MREADDLTNFMCRISWKSGSLNFLELSGPHRVYYGTPVFTTKIKEERFSETSQVSVRPNALTSQKPLFYLVTATGILNKDEV